MPLEPVMTKGTLPCQSEANRQTRMSWGAFEQLRAAIATRLPEDDCQQVDTSAAGEAPVPGPRSGPVSRPRQRPGHPLRP
jgi:hypothetical protein